MCEYIAGILTVPERSEVIKPVLRELKAKGIPFIVFMDEEHKGHKWNMSRMLTYFCTHHGDKHYIMLMDDIEFKDGWFEKINEIINNTDYDVVSLFTNIPYKPDDVCGIHKASQKWWMYDHCTVFRKGVLTPKWFDGFMGFCVSPDRVPQETRHYDNMVSHFLYANGYKCGTTRPNFIRLQNVKSILGHNIVIKEN